MHRAPSRAGASNLLARHKVDRLWVTDVASVFAGIEELNAAITEAPTSGGPGSHAARMTAEQTGTELPT